MGDVAEVSSNVPLPEDVVYTQREENTEEDTKVKEEQRVPDNNNEVNGSEPVNESEASKNTPDGLGRYIDVKA
ncbi:MAG: hypothetical protein JSV25_02315 [Spirochaetota bacterium]|nr:MAG: hypothetical protein JSV25_02315 [Spirochaetota bacterium]